MCGKQVGTGVADKVVNYGPLSGRVYIHILRWTELERGEDRFKNILYVLPGNGMP